MAYPNSDFWSTESFSKKDSCTSFLMGLSSTTKFRICLTIENTSFLERLLCILHAFAKGHQGYKINQLWISRSFRPPNLANLGSKSVFGFAERNAPLPSPNETPPLLPPPFPHHHPSHIQLWTWQIHNLLEKIIFCPFLCFSLRFSPFSPQNLKFFYL